MLANDAFRSKFELTLSALRYWIPTVSDGAAVEESDMGDVWKLTARPYTPGACPFELVLRLDQHFDLLVDDYFVEDQKITDLEMFVPLVEAIEAGRVVLTHEVSALTGGRLAAACRIDMEGGAVWQSARGALGARNDDVILDETHYLPYRR